MADISLCTSTDCPKRKTCKRSTEPPDRYAQSYFNPYLYGTICRYFISNQNNNEQKSFSWVGWVEGEECSESS